MSFRKARKVVPLTALCLAMAGTTLAQGGGPVNSLTPSSKVTWVPSIAVPGFEVGTATIKGSYTTDANSFASYIKVELSMNGQISGTDRARPYPDLNNPLIGTYTSSIAPQHVEPVGVRNYNYKVTHVLWGIHPNGQAIVLANAPPEFIDM
jgi:hypothetical protein